MIIDQGISAVKSYGIPFRNDDNNVMNVPNSLHTFE